MNLLAKQKQRHRRREQIDGCDGEGEGDELGDWDGHQYTTMYKTDN